jgi:hypothetical protein
MSVSAAAQLMSVTLYSRRFFPYYAFCMVAGLDEKGICYLKVLYHDLVFILTLIRQNKVLVLFMATMRLDLLREIITGAWDLVKTLLCLYSITL